MIAKEILKISSGIIPHDVTQEAWCTSSNLEASYSLHDSEIVKAGIDEYNTSYDETVERSEENFVTHPSHIICYDETRFRLTQKCTRTNTNVERTLCESEGDTCEVLSICYEFNCTPIEDNDKIVEAVGKLNKPGMAAILVMYQTTVRI